MLALASCVQHAEKKLPLADVHLHYNPDQAEVTSTDEALQTLRDNHVLFGVVSSKPPSMALELVEASGGWLIAHYMPYLEPDRKRDWFFDDRVLPAAREALASGRFRGLGEMHLIVGYAPSLKKRQPIIDGMLDLAEEFDVPAVIHAEASNYRYFLPLCQRHPRAKIQWAHAGSVLQPGQVAELMRACPNVWAELSARDHMRYGQTNPIVDEQGLLLPEWQDFVAEFQDRIMIASDPFYIEGDNSWDTPNTGWLHVDEVIAFHRRWLSGLPQDIQRKLAYENALRFYGEDAKRAIAAGPLAKRVRQ
jgi:hypothetical protein